MYSVEVCEGIVLYKRGLGEADALVYVLANTLGLVRAKAIGARLQKSKLRYGLEPLSLGRYSFVRGKKEWRLTGAEQIDRSLLDAKQPERRRLAQVSALLVRLVPGQEEAFRLFGIVRDGFASLARTTVHADALECVLVLRILAQLGYVPELPSLSPFVEGSAYTPELAAQAEASRKLLVKLINDSLQATGL